MTSHKHNYFLRTISRSYLKPNVSTSTLLFKCKKCGKHITRAMTKGELRVWIKMEKLEKSAWGWKL